MSSFDANESDIQSGFVVDILGHFVNVNGIDAISFIVRKSAHFIEYVVLGSLALNCLKDYEISNRIFLSIVFCVLYAITDEFHQTFIPGRSGLVFDVLIDSCGALCGVFLYYIIRIKMCYEKQIR